jgi:hypothetical protein
MAAVSLDLPSPAAPKAHTLKISAAWMGTAMDVAM